MWKVTLGRFQALVNSVLGKWWKRNFDMITYGGIKALSVNECCLTMGKDWRQQCSHSKKNNYDFTLDLLIPMLVLVFPSTEVGEGGRWQKIVFTDIFIWRMTAVAAMHLVSPLTCSMGGGCFRQNTRPLDLFTRSLISSILGQAAVSRRVLSEEVLPRPIEGKCH